MVPRALCNRLWYGVGGFAVHLGNPSGYRLSPARFLRCGAFSASRVRCVLYRWVCRCRSGKPTLWNLAPLRRGFFVRRVSGRNENPSRVVLQPDVGHGLFQGRREPNTRHVTRISPLRCATDCVVLSRWVCRYSHRQALDETRLSPAAAGLFRAGPPRSAQPTEWLGVGVVGLRFGEIGKPVMATNMTHLAPSPWRGFCLAAPAPSAGSLPMPVGCPAVTQRGVPPATE